MQLILTDGNISLGQLLADIRTDRSRSDIKIENVGESIIILNADDTELNQADQDAIILISSIAERI